MRIKRKHINSRSTNVPKYIISGGGIREMDRLTEMNENKTAHFYPQCFEKCGGVGYSRKCDSCDLIDKVCDKLGEYEDLEEQGKLLKLEGKYQKIMIRQEFWIVVNGSDVRHGRSPLGYFEFWVNFMIPEAGAFFYVYKAFSVLNILDFISNVNNLI